MFELLQAVFFAAEEYQYQRYGLNLVHSDNA